MVLWDDLGFRTNYSVDPEPEYPGDGVWGYPEFRVAEPDAILSGGPLALIRPAEGESWLVAAEIPYVGGLYGTPDPNAFCLFDRDQRAVLVDVRNPSAQTVIHSYPVRINAARDEQLLLIEDYWFVTAWGIDGLAWESEQLFDDDLHIRRTDNGRIVCRGLKYPAVEPVEVTLDAATGRVIS